MKCFNMSWINWSFFIINWSYLLVGPSAIELFFSCPSFYCGKRSFSLNKMLNCFIPVVLQEESVYFHRTWGIGCSSTWGWVQNSYFYIFSLNTKFRKHNIKIYPEYLQKCKSTKTSRNLLNFKKELAHLANFKNFFLLPTLFHAESTDS